MHKLLPLAPLEPVPGTACALADKCAEDVVDGDYLEALVEEARERFPTCEFLWLHFRSHTSDRAQGWQAVRTFMHFTKWYRAVANAGTCDLGAHGMTIFVGIHIRGELSLQVAA